MDYDSIRTLLLTIANLASQPNANWQSIDNSLSWCLTSSVGQSAPSFFGNIAFMRNAMMTDNSSGVVYTMQDILNDVNSGIAAIDNV